MIIGQSKREKGSVQNFYTKYNTMTYTQTLKSLILEVLGLIPKKSQMFPGQKVDIYDDNHPGSAGPVGDHKIDPTTGKNHYSLWMRKAILASTPDMDGTVPLAGGQPVAPLRHKFDIEVTAAKEKRDPGTEVEVNDKKARRV